MVIKLHITLQADKHILCSCMDNGRLQNQKISHQMK